MWHSLKKDDYLKPASDLNWFDIKVIFDGSGLGGDVAEPLEEQYDEADPFDIYGNYEATRIYGKYVPILLWNNSVLDHKFIERFTLYYDSFTPYLHLVLNDFNGQLQFSDVPGMANVVTLIMLPHADGKYKSVKINFYIQNISYRGQYIICDCELRCFPLEEAHTEQLWFHWPTPGCPTDHVKGVGEWSNEITDCPLPPNKHPNTYELLHVIAENTGLGFAATDMCSSVRDDKHRILQRERYKDTIEKHVKFGGTDADNIFDSWIDLYGYITMVNVPWVMTRNIDFNNLAIHAELGFGLTDSQLSENSITPLTHRVITNLTAPYPSNMIVESLENMVDNSAFFNTGSFNTYFDLNPLGCSGDNSISTLSLQAVENSLDGKDTSKYKFDNVCYRGAEMGVQGDGNFPEMQQKDINTKYFQKLRAKRLKVKMAAPNYGLVRGTLVGLVWFETEMTKKRDIIANSQNAHTANKVEKRSLSSDEIDIILDSEAPVANPYVSGIYYIDGMIFEYEESTNVFTQYLILIKKAGDAYPDMLSSQTNHSTINKES